MNAATPVSDARAPLSESQIAFYREQGYIVVENVFDAGTLCAARDTLAAFVDRSRRIAQGDDIFDLEPDHTADAPRIRRLKSPHLHHPFWAEAARVPRLVAILKQLLGPAVRFHHSKLNVKAPHGGSPIEWHQDWAFLPHTNDDALAVGIMLEDCNPENGPLLVLPKTHRGIVYDHHANGMFAGMIDPPALEDKPTQAVAMTGPAGSAGFFHVRTVHGSAQNHSARPRPLLLYEYTAADAWPLYGFTDLASFDANLICGEPTVAPRMEKLPVRMPLPRPSERLSIYERQLDSPNRYFSFVKPK